MPNTRTDAIADSSSGPIAVPVGNKLTPINLALVHSGSYWQPQNSDLPIKFPADLSDSIKVPLSNGLGTAEIRPAAGSATGTLQGDHKLFYANAFPDTDAIAEALPSGTEISWTLRSPSAPASLPLKLEFFPGVKYTQIQGGSVNVSIGNTPVASIEAPTAYDAQQRPVSASYSISPDGLDVAVDHRGKDIAYPVVVDPYVVYYSTPAFADANASGSYIDGYSSFAFSTNNGTNMSSSITADGSGYRHFINTPKGAAGAALGAYIRMPVNNATYFAANFYGMWHQSTNYTDVTAGIADSNGSFQGTVFSNPAPNTMNTWTDAILCAVPSCSLSGTTTPGNRARFQSWLHNQPTGHTTTTAQSASFRGGIFYFSDSAAPTRTYTTTAAPTWSNATSVNYSVSNISDPGVGVGNGPPQFAGAALDVWRLNYATGAMDNLYRNGPVCGGGLEAPCPTSVPGPYTFTQTNTGDPLAPSYLREGVQQIETRSVDIVGNTTTTPQTVLSDRSAPAISIGGRLGAFVRPGLTATDQARTVTHDAPFSVTATDGTHTDAQGQVAKNLWRSGVQRLQVWIDPANASDTSDSNANAIGIDGTNYGLGSNGSNWYNQTTSCDGSVATDSCQKTAKLTFPTTNLSTGVYYVHVRAIDAVGNRGLDTTYKIGVGQGDITSVKEGQQTARYVPLQALRTRPGAIAARFQWRPSLTQPWVDIPSAALRVESDKSVPPSPADFSLDSSGATSRAILDADQLIVDQWGAPLGSPNFNPGSGAKIKDGKFAVRALFNPTAGPPIEPRVSEDVMVTLDRGGAQTNDQTSSLGSGSADLSTGNLSISGTDFSQSAYLNNLAVSRTYNSRYASPSDDAGIPRKVGPLGPGWNINLTDGDAGDFKSVTDYNDPALPEDKQYPMATVNLNDGSSIVFDLSDTGSDPAVDSYKPEPGFENLRLVRNTQVNDHVTTKSFVLTDNDTGAVVTFDVRDDSVATGTFKQDTITYPQSTKTITYGYTSTLSNGANIMVGLQAAQWVSDMKAPVQGAGTSTPNCTDMSVNAARGCQWLHFKYDPMGPLSQPRLTEVDLRTWDPASGTSGAMVSVPVVKYGYSNDAAAQLTSEWDPRLTTNPLVTGYGYDANNLLTSISPPGENALTYAYVPTSASGDLSPGRVSSSSRAGVSDGTAPSATATTTVTYGVPVTGGGAPRDMSPNAIAAWGQPVPPWTATAVLPPNAASGTDFAKAAVSYLDPLGREIDHLSPGNRLSESEYDKWGNVTRTLDAENLARALADTGNTLADSRLWDTQNTYDDVLNSSTNARHLVKTIGPQHQMRLDDNTWVQGRTQTQTSYDEHAPDVTKVEDPLGSGVHPEPLDLPTTVQEGALVNGVVQNTRTTTMAYDDGSVFSGDQAKYDQWKFRAPRLTTIDPGGLNIQKKVTLNTEGFVTARFQPRSQSSSEPSTTKTVYYQAGTGSGVTACDDKAQWSGLPCQVAPGQQPNSSIDGTALPHLPIKTITYNLYRQPVNSDESFDNSSVKRTTINTYDAVGRISRQSIVSSPVGGAGDAIKDVEHVYNAATGRETATRFTDQSKTISRNYNALGELVSYVDSEGHTASTKTYDLLGRPATQSDGKGTRTNTFDATTGDLTQSVDSQAGTFTGAYDADGRLISTVLPGGVVQKSMSYDNDGSIYNLHYAKISGCSSSCDLYNDFATENAHGQINGIWTNTAGKPDTSQLYDFDAAGRLTRTQDWHVAGGGNYCKLRNYAYDKNAPNSAGLDSNRTSIQSVPDQSGDCNWSGAGTSKSSSYDAADRLTNSGYTYDQFGRMTTVPQADAGGSSNMTATYYVNDLAHTATDSGTTQTINLDPNLRMSTKVKTGGTSSTEYYAYSDDSDAPAWISPSAGASPPTFSRYVDGMGGDTGATVDQTLAVNLQIGDIRGDIVADCSIGGALSNIDSVDEFGVPSTSLPSGRRYAFKGGKQREALTSSGTVAMGVRLYLPQQGQFMQTDPVLGGNADPYGYPGDPVNQSDLSGELALCSFMPSKPRVRHPYKGSKPIVYSFTDLKCSGLGDAATVKMTVTLSYRSGRGDAWQQLTFHVGTAEVINGKAHMRVSVDAFCKKGINDYHATALAKVNKKWDEGAYGLPFAEGPWDTLNCPNGV